MTDAYARTSRTTASRFRDRMSYDRAATHAILDEAYHCHLGFVVDGEPRILPTLHVRVGDQLYLHGSTASRPLLAARTDEGLAVSVAVTHLDGLVYGRSWFHHSANYRSVVAHGIARLVTDDAERLRVLTALVEKVGRGRSADSRPPTARELAQTAVLALQLREVSVKARTGGVIDEPEDHHLPHWAGVLPLRLAPGVPEPDTGVTAATPPYLLPSRSPCEVSMWCLSRSPRRMWTASSRRWTTRRSGGSCPRRARAAVSRSPRWWQPRPDSSGSASGWPGPSATQCPAR